MGEWAGGVGVRVRAVDGKAQEIRTRLFYNYFQLFPLIISIVVCLEHALPTGPYKCAINPFDRTRD